jgi:hypothetical protein
LSVALPSSEVLSVALPSFEVSCRIMVMTESVHPRTECCTQAMFEFQTFVHTP